MSEAVVTRIVNRVRARNTEAKDALFTLLYDALRKLARVRMARQRAGHSLPPTARVNEALLRLPVFDLHPGKELAFLSCMALELDEQGSPR